MVSIAKQSVKKLLGCAIRAEMDANKTYAKMAARVKNVLLKEKFQILALEEKKHRQVLERLFACLYKKEKPEVPKTVDERLLPAVIIKPSSSLADILGQAMKGEQSARDFYAALAKRVQGANKKMLAYLSHVENSHYLMLRSEYTLALEFEDYAEKDIDKVIT
ncbi:MAG: ferritin family protein [Candidatus Aminicenantes bacterium]|nr:ferritin family protein [Candidatus Aminicenantes bacterium]